MEESLPLSFINNEFQYKLKSLYINNKFIFEEVQFIDLWKVEVIILLVRSSFGYVNKVIRNAWFLNSFF